MGAAADRKDDVAPLRVVFRQLGHERCCLGKRQVLAVDPDRDLGVCWDTGRRTGAEGEPQKWAIFGYRRPWEAVVELVRGRVGVAVRGVFFPSLSLRWRGGCAAGVGAALPTHDALDHHGRDAREHGLAYRG